VKAGRTRPEPSAVPLRGPVQGQPKLLGAWQCEAEVRVTETKWERHGVRAGYIAAERRGWD
jgi:hypothetical protein